MRLRNLLDDDSAVSPVIGVILMVAITVILAAVIASFVLGLSPGGSVAPTADFSFNYDPGADELTITHTSGDNIREDELFIRGSGLGATGQWSAHAGGSSPFSNPTTDGGEASASLEGVSAVSSGDSVVVTSVDSDYVARVIWESTQGDQSAQLAEDRGPDA